MAKETGLGGRSRGAEPTPRRKAAKNTEQLKCFRARDVLDGRLKLRRRVRRHFAPIGKSANESKKNQSAHQDGDRHPKMDIGEDACEAIRDGLICAGRVHGLMLLEISGPVDNGGERS